MARYGKKTRETVKETMEIFKKGELKSGKRRLLEPIGGIPAAEYEMLYWTESGRTDTVGLTELGLH